MQLNLSPQITCLERPKFSGQCWWSFNTGFTVQGVGQKIPHNKFVLLAIAVFILSCLYLLTRILTTRTCDSLERPSHCPHKCGLLRQVVFGDRFYYTEKQDFLPKAGGPSRQVVSCGSGLSRQVSLYYSFLVWSQVQVLCPSYQTFISRPPAIITIPMGAWS